MTNLNLWWLLRLRWAAVVGQIVVITVCHTVLHITLPLVPLAIVVLGTMASQVMLWQLARYIDEPIDSLVGSILVLDTMLLTILLYFTGGPHNPFTACYLIHIVMAASLLGSRWTWMVLGTAVSGFAFLFWKNVPLVHMSHSSSQTQNEQLHFVGMFVALTITGACLSWFVARLNTQLRERDSALCLAELNAERDARFASLATLAAGVAHEINSPLATITVAAKELQYHASEVVLPEEVLEDARLIQSAVARCQEILSRLRMQTGEDSHDPPTTITHADIESDIRQRLPAQQQDRVSVHNPTPDWSGVFPRHALIQTLHNLVQNAIDAAPPLSPIVIEIAHHEAHVSFTVQDDGAGVAPHVLSRIGEPFVTTKDPGRGTGLGLFLVRRFAEEMGGHFTLTSTPHQGTRACLRLPIVPIL